MACLLQGKVLAGINSRLQLYGWGQGSDGTMELSAEAGYSGFVLCLYVAVRGDFITVGESTALGRPLLQWLPVDMAAIRMNLAITLKGCFACLLCP